MTDQSAPFGAPAQATQPQAKTNVLAIVSLVSSFIVGLAGVITGHIALSQIKKTGQNGRGLAIAGVIIGYVSIVFWVIFAIVMTFVFSGLVSTCADLGPGTHLVDGVTYTCS